MFFPSEKQLQYALASSIASVKKLTAAGKSSLFRTLPNLASGPGQKNRNTGILFDGLPAQTLGHLNRPGFSRHSVAG
jgi:hypothetical protein